MTYYTHFRQIAGLFSTFEAGKSSNKCLRKEHGDKNSESSKTLHPQGSSLVIDGPVYSFGVRDERRQRGMEAKEKKMQAGNETEGASGERD